MIDVIRTVYLIQLQYCTLRTHSIFREQSVGLNVLIHKFNGVYNVVLRLDAMYVAEIMWRITFDRTIVEHAKSPIHRLHVNFVMLVPNTRI